MQQDTKNKLLTGTIIGIGTLGAIFIASMGDAVQRITSCQQSAECQLAKFAAPTKSP
jgi:hypothetical protein